MTMNKLLVAIDGSEASWKALGWAADAAKLSDAELLILHVVHYEPIPDAVYELANAEHEDVAEEVARFRMGRTLGDNLTREATARAKTKGVGRVSASTAEGRVADQIVDAVKKNNVDTVVVGSRGFGSVKGLLLGSVSHRVANLAGCTCVIVPA